MANRNLSPNAKAFYLALTKEDWKSRLSHSPEAYHILREKGTERPFKGLYYKHFRSTGTYHCAGCDAPLFDAKAKFDSGCGWPAFSIPTTAESIITLPDSSHGMERIEVQCSTCHGHLGHLFDDGPRDKGGLRYCINSTAMFFQDPESKDENR
jgi:peptide-methionine (R)-S-oxide reductase